MIGRTRTHLTKSNKNSWRRSVEKPENISGNIDVHAILQLEDRPRHPMSLHLPLFNPPRCCGRPRRCRSPPCLPLLEWRRHNLHHHRLWSAPPLSSTPRSMFTWVVCLTLLLLPCPHLHPVSIRLLPFAPHYACRRHPCPSPPYLHLLDLWRPLRHL